MVINGELVLHNMEEFVQLTSNRKLTEELLGHILQTIDNQALRCLSSNKIFGYADAVAAIQQAFNEINPVDEKPQKTTITNHSA